MTPFATRVVIALGALLVLGAINYAIHGKEHTIEHGEVIYLELAPVDPRSLMQGDYMALRFKLAGAINTSRDASSIALLLDERRVATLDPSDGGRLRIRYRVQNGQVWLGTNAYFFQEGTADRYTDAHYGEFRIDPQSGDAVLVGLCDLELRRL